MNRQGAKAARAAGEGVGDHPSRKAPGGALEDSSPSADSPALILACSASWRLKAFCTTTPQSGVVDLRGWVFLGFYGLSTFHPYGVLFVKLCDLRIPPFSPRSRDRHEGKLSGLKLSAFFSAHSAALRETVFVFAFVFVLIGVIRG